MADSIRTTRALLVAGPLLAGLVLAGCSSASEGSEADPAASASSTTAELGGSIVEMDEIVGVEVPSTIEAVAGMEVPDEDTPDGATVADAFAEDESDELDIETAEVVVHVGHDPGMTQPESTTVVAGTKVAVAVRTPVDAELAVAGLGASAPTNGDAAVVVVVADRLGQFDVTVGAEVVARIVVVAE